MQPSRRSDKTCMSIQSVSRGRQGGHHPFAPLFLPREIFFAVDAMFPWSAERTTYQRINVSCTIGITNIQRTLEEDSPLKGPSSKRQDEPPWSPLFGRNSKHSALRSWEVRETKFEAIVSLNLQISARGERPGVHRQGYQDVRTRDCLSSSLPSFFRGHG